jgi:hypothetical protein
VVTNHVWWRREKARHVVTAPDGREKRPPVLDSTVQSTIDYLDQTVINELARSQKCSCLSKKFGRPTEEAHLQHAQPAQSLNSLKAARRVLKIAAEPASTCMKLEASNRCARFAFGLRNITFRGQHYGRPGSDRRQSGPTARSGLWLRLLNRTPGPTPRSDPRPGVGCDSAAKRCRDPVCASGRESNFYRFLTPFLLG